MAAGVGGAVSAACKLRVKNISAPSIRMETASGFMKGSTFLANENYYYNIVGPKLVKDYDVIIFPAEFDL